jgi:CubicO group peptidase (beta-lactamase class C family)
MGDFAAQQAGRRLYKYNDTRTNVLALAALNVWRRPLPQILKENIMDPIGATSTWRWFGYENSWVVLDGSPVQSVTGGGHWGGGMYINAYDKAASVTSRYVTASGKIVNCSRING